VGERINVMLFRRTGETIGGPETLLHGVAKYIDREAFKLTVVDFAPSADFRSRFLQDIAGFGVETASIPARGKFDFRSVKFLADLLEQRRIDVLHTHDHRSNFVGFWATRRRPTPIMVTSHQPLRRYWWLRHIEILDDHLIRRFDRILPVAQAVADEILAKRPDLSARTITVLNGVDLDLFKVNGRARGDIRAELGIPDNVFLCVTLGRIMEDKGLTYLIDAQRQLAHAGMEVYQLLVGIGPQMEMLQRRVRQLGLEHRIRFTGHRRDIPDLLHACDLLVVSSLSEGLSVAIIEGMAAGLPVVATRVGGNHEVVVDNETGLIVAPRDPRGLANAILTLVEDPQRREAMGRRARQLAFAKWSIQRMVRDYERVYRDVVAECRQSAGPPLSGTATL
jgi:glycosyltransferase involved in cell wall biosynthesis